MKNFIKLLVIALVLSSCDNTQPVTFDPVNGQTGISFAEASVDDIVVPTEGITVPVGILSTTVSDVDRTFNVTVDESSTATSQDYSIGTLTIPANSYVGTFDVTFNYDNLEDFVSNTLVLNLDLPEGVVGLTSQITYNFVKYFDVSTFVCTDFTLTIVTDDYGSETSWDIKDSTSGVTVQSGGPYSDGTAGQAQTTSFSLAGGCYTFTIHDAYGDGLYDGNTTGTYDLTCSIVNYASGSGNFGSSESTDFCVNE
jgi:hypothetical protein